MKRATIVLAVATAVVLIAAQLALADTKATSNGKTYYGFKEQGIGRPNPSVNAPMDPIHTGIIGGNAWKLEGLVEDVETGEPLPFVYVEVEGCNTAAMTNQNGKFYLQGVPTGPCVLKISRKGYREYEGEIRFARKPNLMLKIGLMKELVQPADKSVVKPSKTKT